MMMTLKQQHQKAMTIAEEAFIALREDRIQMALDLFSQGFELEVAVARQTDAEPARSILYRSAATLAFHARRYRDAERTVAQGLLGNPPVEIAQELRTLFEKITLHTQTGIETEMPSQEAFQRITGKFVYAEAHQAHTIKIIDDENATYTIEVAEDIAELLVRAYFGERVIVDARRINDKQLVFQQIQVAS